MKASDSSDLSEETADRETESDRQVLAQLRQLLLSKDQRKISDAVSRLDEIEKRLNDPERRMREVNEVILPVLQKRLSEDQGLRQILQPVLIDQFHKSARQEPEVMAEALFPILGPAIRKMIGNLLSPDKHTRKRTYKLEQLLLIEKQSGLPLCQVSSDAAVSQDADMVSGMLTAIQSFVHDAFSADEFDGLNTLQVGELSVWIEWGPTAVLAAVVRGAAPQTLREAMRLYLETIHAECGESLEQYKGDSEEFIALRPGLYDLLRHHDGSLKNRVKAMPTSQRRALLSSCIVVICLLGWWAYNFYDAQKWKQYVSRLNSIPGVVVVNDERSFQHYRIIALKDPSVSIPAHLVEEYNINPKFVSYQIEGYHGLHPDLILQRISRTLNIPDNVSLSLEGTVLKLTGEVDYLLLEDVRQMLSNVSGVENVVFSDSD